MKKLCFILSVLFSFMLSVKATDFVVGGIVYSINSDNSSVTVRGNKLSTFSPVFIPAVVTNPNTSISYSVTTIGESAFFSSWNIVELSIPSSVSIIEQKAFMNCSYLVNINISESVESIGADAFTGTSWYNNLPDGMVYINRVLYSFKGEIPKDSAIFIEPYVVSVSSGAFYSQQEMSSISIPSSVCEIGELAFYNCISLDTVLLPEGLENLSNGLFSGCSNLLKVTLPDGLKTIGYESFMDCYMLSDINIPISLESISDFAFSGCSSLNSFDLSTSPNLSYIGQEVFSHCDNLETVIFPNTLLDIGNSTFRNCYNLSSVTLSQSLTAINESLFENCSSLNAIILPDGVTSIGTKAFKGCELIDQISIPDRVFFISDNAFSNCLSLGSINFGEESKLRYLASNAFSGTLWYNNQADGFLYLSNVLFGYKGAMPSNTSLIVHDGTRSITPNAFAGQANLISVNIPGTVDTIAIYAFNNCTNLSVVTMNNGVNYIGEGAFFNCVNLDSVSFSNTLTDIGNSSFFRCLSLSRINLPESIVNIGMNAFYSCTSLQEIFIPRNVVNIGQMAFLGCLSLEKIVVDNLNSNYSGIEGVLFDKSVKKLITYPTASANTQYSLPPEVEIISDYAFENSLNLTSVLLPSGLVEIGPFSFSLCVNLAEIHSLSHIPPSCLVNSFFNVRVSECLLYVSGYSFNQYQAHQVWGDFIHISTKIDVPLSEKEILSKSYFNLKGIEIEIPAHGIVIEKTKYIDGTECIRKLLY